MASIDHVKTGFAVVGVLAVATSALVVVKRILEARRDDRRVRQIARLQAELEAANSALEQKTLESERAAMEADRKRTGKPIKVYIDGCFDMMHIGHSNALRQARAAGTYLVVGLIGDKDIIRNKGSPPVMPMEERYIALKSCKFVDEIIQNAPYDLTPEFTHKLKDQYKIDYIVHGDDPCITCDGKDAYATAKELNMFKTIKRTEGISTTDLVGRMLLMSRDHHVRSATGVDEETAASMNESKMRARAMSGEGDELLKETRISNFLPTARRIVQFADGRAPKPSDRVIYTAGSWDLFNAGHMAFLEAAKAKGDFLLVGIHSDDTVNAERGGGFPIMNLHERALSVLSCRYVDEVIIGAPWALTADMINSMHITKVVKGENPDQAERPDHTLGPEYQVAAEKGILEVIPSSNPLTASVILERVMKDRETFMARYKRKHASETAYYTKSKSEAGYVQET